MPASSLASLVQRSRVPFLEDEKLFEAGLEEAPLPLAVLDLDGGTRVLSRGWLECGLDANLNTAFVGPSQPLVRAVVACLKTGRTQSCRIEARGAAQGRWFTFDVNLWPHDGSSPRRIVAAGRDITEEVLAAREAETARAQLAEQVALFDAALGNMPHGLCMVDADMRLILCNAAFGTMYELPLELTRRGAPRQAIIDYCAGRGMAPISGAEDYLVRSAAAAPGQSIIGEMQLADGRTVRVSHTPITGGGYVATHEDISDRIAASARIEYLAYRDTLTNLPNRASFQRAFDAAVEASERHGEIFGVIMIDVDHFKDINDTLGHDAGDALLVNLARTLGRAFRHGDTVARLGGDEFAVVLRNLTGAADLLRPITLLQDLLRAPIAHAGQSFMISASLGAAVHDDPDADALHLLKNADVALYEAKAGGRNRCVVFEPAMRTQVEQRVELLREVRLAIAQGEFDLFYQPVVDIGANCVAGFEALMRWHHPEQGVLPPAAFMAAFDDNDLSLQLGEVALDRALQQMRAWLDEGVEFGRVAVNISSAQFRTGRLAREIAARLKAWNVPAERLTIEVTENVYVGWGAEAVAETVRELHGAGVMIALDDFGTGYASLANLRQFPVDHLKIDKSFVQNTEDDAIVRAVINLGSSMGMKVVAEGVEKAEQLEILSGYGCDQVQGYHFAKPMPASEVAAFLHSFGQG